MKKSTFLLLAFFYSYALPAQSPWQQLTTLPDSIYGSVTNAANGKLYVNLGARTLSYPSAMWGDCNFTNWEYRPTTDSWAAKARYPDTTVFVPYVNGNISCIINPAAAVVDDKIYIGGGINEPSVGIIAFYHTRAYDPISDSWSNPSLQMQPAQLFSTFVLNGNIHSLGGQQRIPQTGTYNLYSHLYYNLQSSVGIGLNPIPFPAVSAPSFVINNEAYLAPSSIIKKYNLGSDSWSDLVSLPQKPTACVAIDSVAYCLVGNRMIAYKPTHSNQYHLKSIVPFASYDNLYQNIAAINDTIYFKINEGELWRYIPALDTVDVLVSNTTTLKDNDLHFFPNPTNSMLYFDLPANLETVTLRIYNVQGALVQEGLLRNKQCDVSTFAAGLYILELTHEVGPWRAKFVKK